MFDLKKLLDDTVKSFTGTKPQPAKTVPQAQRPTPAQTNVTQQWRGVPYRSDVTQPIRVQQQRPVRVQQQPSWQTQLQSQRNTPSVLSRPNTTVSMKPQAPKVQIPEYVPSPLRTPESDRSVRATQGFKAGKSYEDIAKTSGLSSREVIDYRNKYYKNYGNKGVVEDVAREAGKFVGGMVKAGAGIVTRPIHDASDLNRKKGEAELQQINRDYRSGAISPEAAMERAQTLAGKYTTQKAYQDKDGWIRVGTQSPVEFAGNVAQQGIDTSSLLPAGSGAAQGASNAIKMAAPNSSKLLNFANKLDDVARFANPYKGTVAGQGTAGVLRNMGMSDKAADIVGSSLATNARQSAVTGTLQTGADVLSGRGITPESLAMNYGADFAMGAGMELGLSGVGAGIRRGIDMTPTNRTNAHPAVQELKLKGDELLAQRQSLFDRGLSPDNPAVKQVDRAIKAVGAEYNSVYKQVLDGYKTQAQGGYIAGPKALGFGDAQKQGLVFDGVDGKPRFEVDDSGAKIKNPNGKTLGEVLDHPELYRQYPDLRNVKVEYAKSNDFNGHFDGGNNTLTLNPSLPLDKQLGTVLHETQHGIQSIENFAKGTSPNANTGMRLSDKAFNELYDRVGKNRLAVSYWKRAIESGKTIDEIIAEEETLRGTKLPTENIKAIKMSNSAEDANKILALTEKSLQREMDAKKVGSEQYHNSAGEAEARAVEARMNMPMSERYVEYGQSDHKTATNAPNQESLPAGKYKKTLNVLDKDDEAYLRRIFTDDQVDQFKRGDFSHFRGGGKEYYESIAHANITIETPKTLAQKLEGRISDAKLSSTKLYHVSDAQNTNSILTGGFKKGSKLPKNAYRGGGYGEMQDSISFSTHVEGTDRFATGKRGVMFETDIKPDAKIVTIKGISDATELNEFIPELKKQGVDAVYINGGEKEVVVVNPKVVKKPKKYREFDTFSGKAKEQLAGFGTTPPPNLRSTFYDSLDVPKEDLIIKNGGSLSNSMNDGTPLYHGTAKGNVFDAFDTNKANSGVGNNSLHQGNAVYLTNNRDAAEYFSKQATRNAKLRDRNLSLEEATGGEDIAGEIYKVNLSKDAKVKKLSQRPTPEQAARLQKEGYDAISFPEEAMQAIEGRSKDIKADTIAVFNPEKAHIIRNGDGKAMSVEPQKMTEEEYLARNGATFMGGSDPALHHNRISTKHGQSNAVDKVMKDMSDNDARRAELRAEYRKKVASGEIVAPSATEEKIRKANGHPDLQSTQAARRFLEKQGIDWRQGDTPTSQEPVAQPKVEAPDPTAALKQYGWSSKQDADGTHLFNASGKEVAVIKQGKNGRLTSYYTDGTKIGGSGGDIGAYAENIATKHFYAQKRGIAPTPKVVDVSPEQRRLDLVNERDALQAELDSKNGRVYGNRYTEIANRMDDIDMELSKLDRGVTPTPKPEAPQVGKTDPNRGWKLSNQVDEGNRIFSDAQHAATKKMDEFRTANNGKPFTDAQKKELNIYIDQMDKGLNLTKEANAALSTPNVSQVTKTPKQPTAFEKNLEQAGIVPKRTTPKVETPLDPIEADYINERAANYGSPEQFLNETVDRIWKENKAGKGVDFINEDGLTRKVSNNDQFYRAYFNEYGTAPTKKAIKDMVEQRFTGKNGEFTDLLDETALPSVDVAVYKQLKERADALKVAKDTTDYSLAFEKNLEKAGLAPNRGIASKSTGKKQPVQQQSRVSKTNPTQQVSETALAKASKASQVAKAPEQGLTSTTQPSPESQVSTSSRSYADNTTDEVKKRGFVQSVKGSDEVSGQVRRKVSGEYNVRSTAKLALNADDYVKGDIDVVSKDVNTRLDTPLGKITDQDIADSIAVAKRLDGMGKFNESQAIYDKLAEHGTKGGQAIQAFSLLQNRTPEGVKFQMLKHLKKAGVKLSDADQKTVGKLIDEVRKTKVGTEARDRALFNTLDYVSKRIPTSNSDKIVNFWRAGLLTAPKTTAGNILGNTTELATQKLWANPVAVASDKFFSMFTGKRTKTIGSGTVKGMAEGVAKGADYMKTGFDPRSAGNMKYDAPRRVNYKNKVLDTYVNGVYRWMGAQDQPFYYGAKAAAAHDLAKADGINLGYKGQQLAEYVEKSVADSEWKPQTFKTAKDVVDYAKYAVYQNETMLGSMASGLKQGAGRFKGGRAITDFILPFTQVPSSVAMRIIDRTPVGIVKEAVSQMKKGTFDQRAMAEAIGNGSFGIPVIAAGFALANSGELTGQYPTDQKEQKLWEAEGKQPYSVKVDGKWHSLNYMQPFGTLMAIGKQVADDKKDGKSDAEAWMNATGAAAKSIESQSFLQGLNGVLSAVNDPKRSMNQWAKSTASSVVPNFIRSGAVASDDKQRETKTPFDAFKGAIPGVRQTLPTKLDMFGKELEARDDFVNQYANPLKPSKVRNANDATTQELRRLQDAKSGIVTTEFNKKAIAGAELNDAQVRNLNELVNTEVKSRWDKAIQSADYKALSDEDKADYLKKIKDSVADNVKAQFVKDNLINTTGEYGSKSIPSSPGSTSKSSKLDLPHDISPKAKDVLTKYRELKTEKRDGWLKEKNNDKEIRTSLETWLDGRENLPENISNNVAKEWAEFHKGLKDGTINELEREDKMKSVLKTAFYEQISDKERTIYKLSKDELQYYIDNKTLTDQNIENALKVEKQLYNAGIIDKQALARKLGLPAGGYKTSSRSSGSSGSSKGKFDYKLFGFSGSGNGNSNSGELYDILKKATRKFNA